MTVPVPVAWVGERKRCWWIIFVAMVSVEGRGYAQVPGWPAEVPWGGQPAAGRGVNPMPPLLPGPSDGGRPSPYPDFSCPDVPSGGCGPATGGNSDDPFTFLTRRGALWSAFPRTLLWEPPLAGLREPRFLGLPNGLSNAVTDDTVDFAIGNTLGLWRYQPPHSSLQVQLDVFAVVYSRFAEYDYFVAADFRAGVPVTFAYGPWHAKVAYEHTSTHLGDETMARLNLQPFNYIKEEVVFALGRYFFDQQLRLYGQFGYAYYQRVPGDPARARFDLGGEWVRRRATGRLGQPFAAANLEFNGSNDYDPSLSVQLGWLWRDPSRRLAQGRVFAQYYTGYSPLGQFFQTRENWFGAGFAVDY